MHEEPGVLHVAHAARSHAATRRAISRSGRTA
jgi:hypothetical protein